MQIKQEVVERIYISGPIEEAPVMRHVCDANGYKVIKSGSPTRGGGMGTDIKLFEIVGERVKDVTVGDAGA